MKANPAPRRILVPVDFSESSLQALKTARALAKAFGAKLDLLYVQTLPISLQWLGAAGEDPGMPAVIEQLHEFRRWREGQLQAAAEGRARAVIADGDPAREILQRSGPRGADLVVMGTRGRSGARRLFFGSVAEEVVRGGRAPTLTVSGKAPSRIARILVPYNMTSYADKALRYAADFSRRLRAKLCVLCVFPGEARPARAALEARVKKVLGSKARGVRVVAGVGDPRRIVLEMGKSFDLIILSAHRKPLPNVLILGSTAETVLRHAPAPVLSVPSS